MTNKLNAAQAAWRYCKHHRKSILLFSLFILVFLFVFSLYRLTLEAILYAALLCFFTGGMAMALDFLAYYRRHRLLCQLQEKIVYGLDALPPPKNLMEEDYQALLTVMQEEKAKILSHADKSAQEMRDYYTMWAHQIKTPIAAMTLLLQQEEQRILSQGQGDEQLDAYRELSGQLLRIQQYVEMVLSYLRLDSESTDYVIRSYDLDSIVRQAVRKYAAQFIRRKLQLDYSPLNCRVLTDEKWLLFAVEQLLSNAIKYTPAGKISIYREGDKTLVIEDTGIGIAPEDLPRIFEKGFTGYNGRTDKKSTGIGLYLTKRILAKLSHSIEIQSQVGKGTKIMIHLEQVSLSPELS